MPIHSTLPAVPVHRGPSATTLKLKDQVGSAASLLKDIARKADTDFDGVLSYADIRAVLRAVQDGNVLSRALGGVFGYAKSQARTATVTLAQFNQAVDVMRAAVLAVDKDGSGDLSPSEWTKLGRKKTASAFYDFSTLYRDRTDGPINFLFDHDGDLPVSARDPITKKGKALQVAQRIVWFHNQRANDNRWPKWAGRVISRDVLEVAEAKSVVAEIGRLPPAKAKSVLRALSSWITAGGPGCLYLKPDAVPLFDALAKKLGVKASFVGPRTAPAVSI